MSWYGAHPKISKAEARKISGPKACRKCLYATQVFKTPHRCALCSPTAAVGNSMMIRRTRFGLKFRMWRDQK